MPGIAPFWPLHLRFGGKRRLFGATSCFQGLFATGDSTVPPEPLQLAYTISLDGILTGFDIGYQLYDDASEAESFRLAHHLGASIVQFIEGHPTQTFWLDVFDRVRLSGRTHVLPYRCDGPNLKRYMRVVLSPERDKLLRLEHYLVRVSPLPLPLRFRSETSAPSIRCSICNDVRHGGVWREPEMALDLGLLKAGSINRVIYDICDDCKRLPDRVD